MPNRRDENSEDEYINQQLTKLDMDSVQSNFTRFEYFDKYSRRKKNKRIDLLALLRDKDDIEDAETNSDLMFTD